MFQTPRFSVPRAACCPCGAVALADKPPVAHSLTVTDFARQSSLENDCFSFSVVEGERVSISVLSDSGGPNFNAGWRLLNSAGDDVCGGFGVGSFTCGPLSAAGNPYRIEVWDADLDDTGVYTVVVSGDCIPPPCGNDVLDPDEQCDPPGGCCTAPCQFALAGTICRPADGECDVAETCQSASAACPLDVFQPPGTLCSDDGSRCTDDVCSSGACTHPNKPNGASCNDGVFCNGSEICQNGSCMPGTPPCSNDGLFCNGTESCNETTDSCQHSGSPYPGDGLFCNGTESCNETTDSCQSPGNPCPFGTTCDESSNQCIGPDLTGSWVSLDQSCTGSGADLRCRIRGALQIKNQNTQNAQTSRLKFYLSSDSTFDSSDTLLKDIAAGPLKAGRTKTKILRASLPIGSSASGKHVIALVDATNAVAETDETNNEIVSGALP